MRRIRRRLRQQDRWNYGRELLDFSVDQTNIRHSSDAKWCLGDDSLHDILQSTVGSTSSE